MEIGVSGPIFTHKSIECSMGYRYPYFKRWEKNVAAILHIYGYIAIFLLFRDFQDTESESCEIEIGISQPIFTNKIYTKGSMGQWYPYYTKWEKFVVILHIYGARAIFYFFMFTMTLSWSSYEKFKLMYLYQ